MIQENTIIHLKQIVDGDGCHFPSDSISANLGSRRMTFFGPLKKTQLRFWGAVAGLPGSAEISAENIAGQTGSGTRLFQQAATLDD